MFTHAKMSRCRDFEDRTGTDSHSADVPLMLLCCHMTWISYGVLTGRNIESACNKMEGMGERGLMIVVIEVAD